MNRLGNNRGTTAGPTLAATDARDVAGFYLHMMYASSIDGMHADGFEVVVFKPSIQNAGNLYCHIS
jgi:hypothetical protein